jgi:hypothetical protein
MKILFLTILIAIVLAGAVLIAVAVKLKPRNGALDKP